MLLEITLQKWLRSCCWPSAPKKLSVKYNSAELLWPCRVDRQVGYSGVVDKASPSPIANGAWHQLWLLPLKCHLSSPTAPLGHTKLIRLDSNKACPSVGLGCSGN